MMWDTGCDPGLAIVNTRRNIRSVRENIQGAAHVDVVWEKRLMMKVVIVLKVEEKLSVKSESMDSWAGLGAAYHRLTIFK